MARGSWTEAGTVTRMLPGQDLPQADPRGDPAVNGLLNARRKHEAENLARSGDPGGHLFDSLFFTLGLYRLSMRKDVNV